MTLLSSTSRKFLSQILVLLDISTPELKRVMFQFQRQFQPGHFRDSDIKHQEKDCHLAQTGQQHQGALCQDPGENRGKWQNKLRSFG